MAITLSLSIAEHTFFWVCEALLFNFSLVLLELEYLVKIQNHRVAIFPLP